jgi:hypothetical protein
MLQTAVETADSVVTGDPVSLTFAQEREYTAQGRAMIVTYWLLKGDGLTIQNVMSLTGLSRSGAYRLMTIVCYHLPVYNENGVWQMCSTREVD